MNEEYLAIVTARMGSKRLPGKNIRNFCGKPLFVWSILAGLECPKVARVLVSTDSEEYQQIAIGVGAECSCLRPSELAADDTSSADVVSEMLERLGEQVSDYRGVVLLQPTSPLRTVEDISSAITLFEMRKAPAVVSVSLSECPPAWLGKLPSNLVLDEFISSRSSGLRSQDLGEWYRLNGAVYVVNTQVFLSEHTFMPPGTVGYVMPRERSIDVDTEFDFRLAELLMVNSICSK